MSQEADQFVVGDAVTAATNAPTAKRRWFAKKANALDLTSCENCGTSLSGSFCSACGQHAIDYRRSFGRVFLDVLDSFLNWDSKFFGTLALLITRPWYLTNEFVAGKRVRHLHPLRLYLLVSIVFFFGVHELAKRADVHNDKPKEMTPEQRASLETELAKLPHEEAETVRAEVTSPLNAKPFIAIETDDHDPKSPFGKWLNDKIKMKIGENGINAKVFLLTVVSNLPAMMLCCIPLFAFVLKTLYLRKHVLYIDHLIYALHIHSFSYVAILLIGFVIAGAERFFGSGGGWITALLIVTSVMMLLVSIRRVYRQGWFMSGVKFLLGAFVYTVVLAVGIAATFFVTLALPD